VNIALRKTATVNRNSSTDQCFGFTVGDVGSKAAPFQIDSLPARPEVCLVTTQAKLQTRHLQTGQAPNQTAK
jgi:hypothetical protein